MTAKTALAATDLQDEYISLAWLIFKLDFAQIADLIEAIPMFGFDAFDRIKPLTKDQAIRVLDWLADFHQSYLRADAHEAIFMKSEMHSEDAVSNINGFLISDLVKSPVIQAALADDNHPLGAELKEMHAMMPLTRDQVIERRQDERLQRLRELGGDYVLQGTTRKWGAKEKNGAVAHLIKELQASGETASDRKAVYNDLQRAAERESKTRREGHAESWHPRA